MTTPLTVPDHAPRHALPLLFAGQVQKEAFVNEALARIDALLFPVVEGAAGDPPAQPAEGQAWLVDAEATGTWTGEEDAIAVWSGGDWLFLRPCDGMRVWDRALDCTRLFLGAWRVPAAPAAPQGGATIDVEARDAIGTLIEQLRSAGFFSP